MVVLSRVNQSERMNDPPHKVWVIICVEEQVVCFHCTYIAGREETLSHAAPTSHRFTVIMLINKNNEHIV